VKERASIVAWRHRKSQNPGSVSCDMQVSASHGLLFPVTERRPYRESKRKTKEMLGKKNFEAAEGIKLPCSRNKRRKDKEHTFQV
jgi:hypothetical protein